MCVGAGERLCGAGLSSSPQAGAWSQTHMANTSLLPGEKLDYKTCEALEEVFKRLQFKVVDLEQTNLDEDVSNPALPHTAPSVPGPPSEF